ncbi:MAG TPA: hypothetical protein VFD25_05305, partial [Clostridia bacterium]|nr:hypothetical protein [Clostridia bacterium]
MEQFFINIWEYLQSPQFTAVLASVLGGYSIVRPIINKVIAVKGANKLSVAQNKINIASKQIEEYKKLLESAKENMHLLMQNSQKQNKAFLLAFDRSNLKEDVKKEIKLLLPNISAKDLTTKKEEFAEKAIDKIVETVHEKTDKIADKVDEA